MLASFDRGGGLATASRATLRRSEIPERITRLYSEFDALLRCARLCAGALVRFAADPAPASQASGAGSAGLAIACTSPRHQNPGAQ